MCWNMRWVPIMCTIMCTSRDDSAFAEQHSQEQHSIASSQAKPWCSLIETDQSQQLAAGVLTHIIPASSVRCMLTCSLLLSNQRSSRSQQLRPPPCCNRCCVVTNYSTAMQAAFTEPAMAAKLAACCHIEHIADTCRST